jgi:hypothetical protein
MKDGAGNPLALATGNHPTDVKVQKVVVTEVPRVEKVFAFVSNAGDDTVTRIDTTNLDPTVTWPQIGLDACQTATHYPTALDTRGYGDYGFTANFSSASVSVINLKVAACQSVPITGTIPVGANPLRITIQPMYSLEQIGKAIRTGLEYAEPSDFTEPAKQPTLVRDWDAVAQLEATLYRAQYSKEEE